MTEIETTFAPTEMPRLAPGGAQAGIATGIALEEAGWMERIEQHPAWPALARMPETITASLPLRRFTVRSLLLLAAGQTIESDQPLTEDIPLRIGPVQIAWGEFEVVEHTMALRVTRIA
jgi:flagellar motor switch/type III secretory pathway protein FliN